MQGNAWIWKHTVKPPESEITRDEVVNLIPRGIIIEGATHDNNDDCGSIDVRSDLDTEDNNSINSNNAESSILTEMLKALKNVGKKDIWSWISPRMLFKYYLADIQVIASSFLVAELNDINKVFKTFTSQNLFLQSGSKSKKGNKICSKFGDQSMWQQQHRCQVKNAKTVKDIAFKMVSSALVPKAVIAVSVTHIKHRMEIKQWENDATVPLKVHIKHHKEDFEMFSYPEYSKKRQQLEPRTLDPTHLLMNLCAHACKSGFTFFDKEAFIHVSETNDKLLSRAIVKHILDHVRSNLAMHLSDTPFTIRQPIQRPCLFERVYKPICTPHWCRVLPLRAQEIGCK